MDPATMMMLAQAAMQGTKMLMGGKGGGGGAPPPIAPKNTGMSGMGMPALNFGAGAGPIQIPTSAPGGGGSPNDLALLRQLMQLQGRA